MKGRRWSHQEDQQLRQAVLNTICNGGTQLEAFHIIGDRIGRTPGACGFRWNAVLRKQDPQSYQEAKRKRVANQIRKSRKTQIESLGQLIEKLKEMEGMERAIRENIASLAKELSQKEYHIQQLQDEKRNLLQGEQESYWIQQEIRERYQELLNIIKRLHQDTSFEKSQPSLQETVSSTRSDSSS